jgi:hypothetical protein
LALSATAGLAGTVNRVLAFAVLRRYSQDNNIKLHVVAAQLISTRQLPHRSRLGRAERSGAKVTGG